jgi:hypothetical protein
MRICEQVLPYVQRLLVDGYERARASQILSSLIRPDYRVDNDYALFETYQHNAYAIIKARDPDNVSTRWKEYISGRLKSIVSCVQSLYLFSRMYKVPMANFHDYDVGLISYYTLIDRLEPFLKYKLTAISSYIMEGAKAPPRPDWIRVPKWYLPLLDSYSLHHRTFEGGHNKRIRIWVGYGLLQLKKGCEPITVTQIKENLKGYADRLSKPAQPLQGFYSGDLTREIDRIIKEMPVNGLYQNIHVPSNAACFQEVGVNNGAVSYINRVVDGETLPLVVSGTHPETISFWARKIQQCEVEVGSVAEVWGDVIDRDLYETILWERNPIYDLPNTGVGISEEDQGWVLVTLGEHENFTRELFVDQDTDPISVGWEVVEVGRSLMYNECTRSSEIDDIMPHAIYDCGPRNLHSDIYTSRPEMVENAVHVVLEPLKARTITASDAHRQFLCTYAQKAIIASCREHPQLALIGGVELNTSLLDRFQVQDEKVIVSVDYKDATDNINMNYTLYAWNSLCDHFLFEPEVRSMGAEILCGGLLHFPLEYDIPDITQRTGQLMGCILSFPILCILNLAGIRVALSVCEKVDANTPILVNGDDALFQANTQQYSAWLDCIDHIGFKLSPGKNYTTNDFLLINSTLFTPFDLNNRTTWGEAPLCNIGIIVGKSRVLSDTRNTRNSGQDDVISWLKLLDKKFLSSPDVRDNIKVYREIRGLYFFYNKQRLSEQSYYLPEWYGGLGLPTPVDDAGHHKPIEDCLNPCENRVVNYLNSLTLKDRLMWQTKLMRQKEKVTMSCVLQALKKDREVPCADGLVEPVNVTFDWLGETGTFNVLSARLNGWRDIVKKSQKSKSFDCEILGPVGSRSADCTYDVLVDVQQLL